MNTPDNPDFPVDNFDTIGLNARIFHQDKASQEQCPGIKSIDTVLIDMRDGAIHANEVFICREHCTTKTQYAEILRAKIIQILDENLERVRALPDQSLPTVGAKHYDI